LSFNRYGVLQTDLVSIFREITGVSGDDDQEKTTLRDFGEWFFSKSCNSLERILAYQEDLVIPGNSPR
jgi:hypothetical protein